MSAEKSRLRELLQHEAAAAGFEVIAVRIDGRNNVRLWIDREEGQPPVTVSDCTRLSRCLTEVLELEGIDAGAYQFEVQSPGLDRLLTRDKDFVRFAGQEITVQLREKREGRARFQGRLLELRGRDVVVAASAAPAAGEEPAEWVFPRSEIKEARLVPQVAFGQPKQPTRQRKQKGRKKSKRK